MRELEVNTATRLRRVLAVLESGTDGRRALVTATDIARRHDASITLAKTCDPGKITRWIGPCFSEAPSVHDAHCLLVNDAGHELARVAEFMPADINFDTVLLPPSTAIGLVELIRARTYDALVAGESFLGHNRALRREAKRRLVTVISVPDP
jgi:hypothetical protein